MLKKYDPLEELLDYEEVSRWMRIPMRHLAGSMMEDLGYGSPDELEQALARTFEVCCHVHIPIEHHFRRVYVFEGDGIKTDWQLSDLGCYLLLVNGNTHNPGVARAQVFFLQRLLQRKEQV